MPQYITVDNQRVKSEDALLDWYNITKGRAENVKSFVKYWADVNPEDAVLCGLIRSILDGEEEVNESGQMRQTFVEVTRPS